MYRITLSFYIQALKKDGKGNRPKAADTLEDRDINLYYEKGLLGNHAPYPLLRTLHKNHMIFFGMRANAEHRSLRWGDVVLGVDEERKYIEYRTERCTKTRTGQEPRNTRQVGNLYNFGYSNLNIQLAENLIQLQVMQT